MDWRSCSFSITHVAACISIETISVDITFGFDKPRHEYSQSMVSGGQLAIEAWYLSVQPEENIYSQMSYFMLRTSGSTQQPCEIITQCYSLALPYIHADSSGHTS